MSAPRIMAQAALLFLLGCALVGLLSGCATVTGAHSAYCGAVGQVAIHVQESYPDLTCHDAVASTRMALAAAELQGAPVIGAWDVTFAWTELGVDHPLARTDPTWRTIRVRRPSDVLHEIFHASLFEQGKGANVHGLMCARGWDQVERKFGVGGPPYCGRGG